jgi:hypothetical protein
LIADDIKCRCETDQVFDMIESNEWIKPGSELYNFIDTKNSDYKCIADLKAEAIKAGYAAIIR